MSYNGVVPLVISPQIFWLLRVLPMLRYSVFFFHCVLSHIKEKPVELCSINFLLCQLDIHSNGYFCCNFIGSLRNLVFVGVREPIRGDGFNAIVIVRSNFSS